MNTLEVTKVYLKSPTNEQIFSFVKEVGVTYRHFEDYYGIAPNILKNVKGGFKPLPKKYWHIFYERIVPTYGSLNNFKKPMGTTETHKTNKVSKVSAKVSEEDDADGNHGRIDWLRKKE